MQNQNRRTIRTFINAHGRTKLRRLTLLLQQLEQSSSQQSGISKKRVSELLHISIEELEQMHDTLKSSASFATSENHHLKAR